MSNPPPGCAAVRAALDEPLTATAPERAASWLLVEHSGPWPSEGLPTDLPREAVDVLEHATALGVRPQLVRRVRDRRRTRSRVSVVSCRPGRAWVEQRDLADLRELRDLDVEALAAGERPGFGAVTSERLVLVCTHGRRDVCCARLGRPLAVRLDAHLPGAVWETSHVGGDRFAPNVVSLPDGSYHGAVQATETPELVEALCSGSVVLRRLRGRAGLPFPAQAADHFLREHTGLLRLDDVAVVSTSRAAGGQTCVEMLADGARWCVHVVVRQSDVERLTSCAGAGTRGAPAAFALAGLRRLA